MLLTHNRLIKEIRIEPGVAERVTTAEYDLAGNIIKTTDTNGNSETKEYDLMNRSIRITDREGNTKRIFYTGTGKLCKEILPEQYVGNNEDGAGKAYFYDADDRLIKVINALGDTETETAYDGNGNVVRQTDAVGDSTEFTYDIGNRSIVISATRS